jgi:hypothetical protein
VQSRRDFEGVTVVLLEKRPGRQVLPVIHEVEQDHE